MEVVERVGGPFSRRNVQEWSRLDQLTGLLEHARVETDHWTASTSNSSHHFGKVVDSRSRNLADGGQEQRQQTKQLEVFQTTVPGGSLQVIRSSTTSSWQSHKTLSRGSGWPNSERLTLPSLENQDFDHLKLSLNPLDLSSQKTKASVGRSGSISSRRPPSRPRNVVGVKTEEASEPADNRRLSELSEICHRVHEQTKKESGRPRTESNSFSCDHNENLSNDESNSQTSDTKTLQSTLDNEVVRSSSDSSVSRKNICLNRKKSCSSEELHTVNEECYETDSNSTEWKRTSKVRRSLQFPPKKTPTHKETIAIPVTKSVAEIKREIEARKQLVTNSFRSNQWNNLAELEGVIGGVISNGHYGGSQPTDDLSPKADDEKSPTKNKKRETFITVESLREVRGRLRKLNSPVDELIKNDDVDDGIDTEVKQISPLLRTNDETPETPINSVKSYVYGMEVMLRKENPQMTGTGSLESRSSIKSMANGINRSEEWYNRRKSYGFEQVNNQQNNYTSFEKSKIESSTDSGICRSSDAFPSWQKLPEKPSNPSSPIKTTHSIIIKPYSGPSDNRLNDNERGSVVQKGRKTVVNLTTNTVNTSWAWNSCKDEVKHPKEALEEVLPRGKIADTIRSLHEKSNTDSQRLSEPITISIPIQQTTKTSHADPSNLLLKQTKNLNVGSKTEIPPTNSQNGITPYSELLFGKDIEESSVNEVKSLFDNIPWRGGRTKTLSNFFDSEFKRHSIAVDQTKYLATKKSYGSYPFNGIGDSNRKEIRTSNTLALSTEKDQLKDSTDSDHESSAHEKKQKRVEFCKTEVHFAAEPGRFNIVETDGKPPPTNLLRRRRKTTSDVPVRSGLPEIRFGDTQYEKNLLSTNEKIASTDVSEETQIYNSKPLLHNREEQEKIQNKQFNRTKPLLDQNHLTLEDLSNQEDDIPKPRSILKNNIPKPKPYLLGESPDNCANEDNPSWGIKLKSIRSDEESAGWHIESDFPKETEFQRLLKSLRPAANKPSDLFENSHQSEQSSTAADNGLEVRITSSALLSDQRRASWSVTDRVRHSDEARGYSTKVNFGPQETTVVDCDKLSSQSHSGSSEGLKSSWLTAGRNSSFDLVPRNSPSYGCGLPQRQGTEAAIVTSDAPKVTSISLRYNDSRQPNITTTTVRPAAIYKASEAKHPVSTFISRGTLDTEPSSIRSKVELSPGGERTWSFSKVPALELVKSNSESDYSAILSLGEKDKSSLFTRDLTTSPCRFSRNSQSPTKESLFLERSAERNIIYNQNSQQMSSSPTSGTSEKNSSSKYFKEDNEIKKTDYSTRSFLTTTKNLSQNSSLNASKVKVDNENKKYDIKKATTENKSRDRKLSTSSSGRDGWLNTPKEVQVRKKPEPSFKRSETKKENQINEKTLKALSGKINIKRTESPIYQNREIYVERKDSNDNTETESTILEELTKAADQILLAVNGYTDDDSFKASSDDEHKKWRERVTSKPLGTISELPAKKTIKNRQSTGVIKSTRSSELRKEYRSSSKGRVNKTSSNSSMENGDVKPLLSAEDRSKRRAARLLQRANSRELLFTAASSSEDLGSGSDTGSLRAKRVFRRPRLQNGKHGSKQDLTSSPADAKIKERFQRSLEATKSSETNKTQKSKTQSENKCSRHLKSVTGPTSSGRRERESQAQTSVSQVSRSQKKRAEASHLEVKSG